MEHVSTLCATGTVGIAATGFALGRPEAQFPACSPRRKPLARTGQYSPLAWSVYLPSRSSSRGGPSGPYSSGFPDATDNPPTRLNGRPAENRATAPSPGPGGILTGAQPSSLSSGAGSRPRRRTYVAPSSKRVDDLRGEPSTPSSSHRPSSSWLGRLSTITSSWDESQTSGSCPQTPSTHSPTAPFFPSHNNVTPNPNKLVKRSTSQSHSSVRIPATPAVLRRPVTSRQRSAAMRERSATDSRVDRNFEASCNASNPFHDLGDSSYPPGGEVWKPFFGSGRPCPERRSGRRVPSARHRNRSPRRLVPDLATTATLLLATDITPESPFYQDYVESLSPYKNITRPVSCGFMDASSRKSNLSAPPWPVPEGKQHRKHHTLSVEEKVASASPSKFKNPGSRPRPRSAIPASQDRPVAESARELSRPIVEMLQESSPQSHRRHVEGSSQRPKTAAFGELNFDHHNNTPLVEHCRRSSLRRVPSFLELRSECRIQGSPTTLSDPQQSTNFSLPLDERQAGTRNSCGSSGPTMTSGRSQRHSAATSDPSSTIAGSDNDIKVFSSGEEDETDFQSDTAFDSISTRAAAGSKCAHRGPRIETIFDPPASADAPNDASGNIADAPVQSTGSPHKRQERTPTHDGNRSFLYSVSGTPGEQTVSAPKLGDIPDESSFLDTPTRDLPLRQVSEERNPRRIGLTPAIYASRSQSPTTISGRCDGSIFDWSEQQQHSSKDGDANSRPRTANPKQVLDPRSGRSSSRGPPSSLHLRSQSVPISRENSKSTESLKSNKFGTWGLGNKGVTEDWDGDFEFDDIEPQTKQESSGTDTQIMDTLAVKVPKSIMERQATLHGQFGQVQELTVLVEELKRLRIRAKELCLLDGPSSELWREAQGIVNLATSDDDGETKEQLSAERHASPPSTASDDSDLDWAFETPDLKLPASHNSFGKRSPLTERINPAVSTMPPLRTESSAKSNRALDNIYQQRDTYDRETFGDPPQKMAFDTQSLRDLVVRAGVVTRALKDVVRRAEGVCATEEADSSVPDPPFRKIFSHPPEPSLAIEL